MAGRMDDHGLWETGGSLGDDHSGDIHSLCGRDKQYTFVSDNMRLRITVCENPESPQIISIPY